MKPELLILVADHLPQSFQFGLAEEAIFTPFHRMGIAE